MERIAEVDAYIEQAPLAQQKTLKALRDLIFEAVPETKEALKWKQPVYSTVKDYVYLKAHPGYVNLGFFNFTQIEAKTELLEGTGKRMRHIKIRQFSEVDRSHLKELIVLASKF